MDGGVSGPANGDGDVSGPGVPFSWSGVSLGMVGASVLRVCLSRVGADTVSLAVADGRGGVGAQCRLACVAGGLC